MNKHIELVPIRKSHTTNTYIGTGDIKPLPVTRYEDEYGATLNSIWKVESILSRIAFLFSGEITLRIYGDSQPPIILITGDIFELAKENHGKV